jgi:hypothetical protein
MAHNRDHDHDHGGGQRPGRLHFAWAGSPAPGRPHYLRVHGPAALVEHDHAQGGASRVDSVWIGPDGRLGSDLLRARYRGAPVPGSD